MDLDLPSGTSPHHNWQQTISLPPSIFSIIHLTTKQKFTLHICTLHSLPHPLALHRTCAGSILYLFSNSLRKTMQYPTPSIGYEQKLELRTPALFFSFTNFHNIFKTACSIFKGPYTINSSVCPVHFSTTPTTRTSSSY